MTTISRFRLSKLSALPTPLLAALVLGLAMPPAMGASPHYKKGGVPVCTVNVAGSTATATCSSGQVAGLGGGDVRVTVSISASAPAVCRNKGNPSNIVRGQNPATGTGSSSIDFSPDQIKNGSLTLPPITATVTLVPPSPAAAGCPNDNWTVTLGPATYGPGVYTFEQPPGTIVAKLTFTF